ncbi:putative reverse transcriptase domain-containing protein [Tanacetum coccineum]
MCGEVIIDFRLELVSLRSSTKHNLLSSSCDPLAFLGFAAALAILITRVSQSRQHSKSEPVVFGCIRDAFSVSDLHYRFTYLRFGHVGFRGFHSHLHGAPPSPDYVTGPKEPEQAPLLPEFVPEPVYPEFMPPEDEVFPAEEQPLPAAFLPTTDSPGYIADSDPEEDEVDLEEDPEEDPKEDPEEDSTDYPTDGGDDDNDDDELSDDDEDEDDDVEEDKDEEEEKRPSLADSVLPLIHRVTARMSVRDQTPISLPLDTDVARLLAIPTPPPSPLSPLSSPLPSILSPLPQILSPPLPVSSPPLPASPTYPLGYRAAMIQLRVKTPSTSHPLPSSTPPSGTPPLLPIPLGYKVAMLLPSTICRAGISEVTLPPRKRLCIALGPRNEVGESSYAPTARPTRDFRADYGFVGTLDDEIRRDLERDVDRIPLGTPPLLPLPTSSPPMLLPSTVCRAGVFEVTLPPRNRLYIALGPRYEVSKSSSAPTARPTRGFRADYGFVGTLDNDIRRDPEREVGYEIIDTWDDMVKDMQGTLLATDMAELSQRMIDFVTTVRQDTYEIYGRLDDAQDDRLLMSGQLKMLHKDRRAYARTARLMETEARLSREACSMDASDIAYFEVRALLRIAGNSLASKVTAEIPEEAGMGVRRQAPPARECTYPDFMKCKSLYFKGTESVIELNQWFERMENVFRISNCSMKKQIKFATCTLLGSALTWWNSHVKTVGHDVTHAMTWTNLKKKMADKYCPRGEIKKLEVEMWNLKVKCIDVVSYNQRFHELALMCARMFPEESDKIVKYIHGLPDMIHRSVMESKPKTMQNAIEFATELMEKKICTFTERQSENKRKQDDNQQQQNKRQNTGRAYASGSGEKKPYEGSKPL